MIEVAVEDTVWGEALGEIEIWAERVRAAAAQFEPSLRGAVALLLTDDDGMRALNAEFRGKVEPTNVLAFPADGNGGFLGDIAMGRGVCAQEARGLGVPFAHHASHLLAHGMLHLIGYDHQTDEEALTMERRETAILAALGMADPYAAPLERKA